MDHPFTVCNWDWMTFVIPSDLLPGDYPVCVRVQCPDCLQCQSCDCGVTCGQTMLHVVARVGDLNEDNLVNISDLLELLGAWGECEIDAACSADLDSNRTVNVSDMLMLLGAWG